MFLSNQNGFTRCKSHSESLALKSAQFLKIDNNLVEDLGRPISTNEIVEVIIAFQRDKPPGSVKLTAEVYKKFAPLLSSSGRYVQHSNTDER